LYAQHTGGLGLTFTNPSIPSANDFASINWTKTATTVIANNTTDPFGGNTADRLTDDVTNSAHELGQDATGPNVLGYAFIEVYAKAGSANFAVISGNTGAIRQCYDLTTGALGASSGVILWATATDAGTGWWLLRMCYLTSDARVTLGMNVTNSVSAYSGAGDHVFLYTAAMTQNLTTTWADQSGNGRNMVQATSFAAPVALPFPSSGSPQAMFFDGDNTRTIAATPADWTFLHNGTGMTWVGVMNGTALIGDLLNRRFFATAAFVGGGGRTPDVGVTFDYQSSLQKVVFTTYNAASTTNMVLSGANGSVAVGATARVIVRFATSNSPNATMWVNGVQVASQGATAPSASPPFYALHYGTIDIAYAKGWLLDSYFYNRAISDYEATGLDRYLKLAYNL